MASRATAKISGRRSKGFSPLVMRARNSSVIAMSCGSVRARMRSSWRFTRSTCLRYRLTMRWFCVPRVLRTIQSRTGIPLKSWLLDMMVFLSARSLARVSGRVGSPCVERRAAQRVLFGKRWRTSTRWFRSRQTPWRCRQAASRLGGRRQRGVLKHHRGAQRELCAGAVDGIAWLGCHTAGGDRVCG